MTERQLVWFRNDLRTQDQIALSEAARQGPVVGVYCLCPEQLRAHDVGGNRVAFVLAHVRALARALDELGIALRIVQVPTFAEVPAALAELASELGARRLWFNEEYPLNERRRDRAVTRRFEAAGIEVRCCTDALVHAPGTVLTGNGDPYTVFTPFRRRWSKLFDPAMARPRGRPQPQQPLPIASDAVPDLPAGFEVTADLAAWPVGEENAVARLESFVEARIERYDEDRDFPALDGTSTLSPWLSIGAVSVRMCLDRALARNDGRLDSGCDGIVTWISELIWREFYKHVVAAWPHVSRGAAFRREYDAFPWREDAAAFAAWTEGRTGFPLIDAAMRQLVATGWMHNRLRMITAMFLTKNLLIDWHAGERFFMQHLLDGDFAANNGGWQWSASTGTDAAPYFRVFSPISQSERFDPQGRFICTWLPQLKGLDARALHDPARRPAMDDYPEALVDAKASRQRAIDTFKAYANG